MFDVVIVGGGPAGLFLAGELRLAGVTPLVLERRLEPSLDDKAHGLTGQSVRLLDHRGLFERCGGGEGRAPTPAPGFFYAGMPLALRTLGAKNPMYLLPVNQRDLERVLRDRAGELGVEVRRGVELVSFTQSDEAVVLVTRGPGGGEATIEARFLVGCDGGGSAVRKQAGVGFPGATDDRIVDRSALVGASDRLRFTSGMRVVVEGLGEIPAAFHRTERGVFSVLPHDPQRPLVNTAEWEDHPAGSFPGPGAPMTLVEMEDSIERVLGVRVPLVPPPAGAPTLLRRLCRRTSRQADRYRVGRVLLAGDAAHVSHGPTLNAAIGDAANLGWKLAAAVQGWALEGLLDTYETERHAVGARVLLHTQAESALLEPGPNVTAMRQLFAELLAKPEALLAVAETMAGADVRHDMGEPDPAAATGWFVPPLEVTTAGETKRFGELARDGRAVLIDGTGSGAIAAVAKRWTPRVKHVVGTAGDPPGEGWLVRPDGYVAWMGTAPATLERALTRWFGGG